MKVKAKTSVRYNGETIPAGQEFVITAEDFELHAGILEATEEDVPPAGEKKLEDRKVDDLKALAAEAGIEGFESMKKAELVDALAKLNPTDQ